MYTCDHELFLALNFDGGSALDRTMQIISGTAMWIPFYLLILWLVWRRNGWRGLLLFIVAAALALGVADIICGIFKQNGLIGGFFTELPARLRPKYTPELEGLVHVVGGGGKYGTVSAHAATIVALIALSAPVIRKCWFTWFGIAAILVICYSRIYMGYHFPIDLFWGTLVGLATGGGFYLLYKKSLSLLKSKKKYGTQ
jgi:undecaprenyl-diphosphatase